MKNLMILCALAIFLMVTVEAAVVRFVEFLIACPFLQGFTKRS